MSKHNRNKRASKNRSVFPFRLLQHWVKPFESGLPCRCGREAHYSVRSFYNLPRWQHLLKIGYTDEEAIKVVWDEALTEQLKGIYNVSHVHYTCRQCVLAIIAVAVGENAAHLAMLPMMVLGELASVVIGAEVTSRDDDGLIFASAVRGQLTTIAELLRCLEGEVIPVNVAASRS